MEKILRVNLKNNQISTENALENDLEKYIGGMGVATGIFIREVPAEIEPYDEKNLLIFSVGPFCGTSVPFCSRHFIMAKSPLTNILGESSSGGFWGTELKFAGFSHIIIEGKSKKPVFLWINDNTIELKDASDLWGKGVFETTELIKKELGENYNVDCIGIAGENLVRYAGIMNDLHRAAGRCGGGAVMGSKKLKAIAVLGKKTVKIANPSAFAEVARKQFELLDQSMFKVTLETFGTNAVIDLVNVRGGFPTKNWQTCVFPQIEEINAQALSEKVLSEPLGCFACPLKCGRRSEIRRGKYEGDKGEGPEYETVGTLGGQCQVTDMEAITKGHYLCNDYGLDTISTGATIAFAMECYEKGILTKSDTGGLELEFSNADVVIELIHKIAKREGFGDLLAEGTRRMAQKLDKGCERFAIQVKGLELPAYDSRAVQITGLAYAVANRGGDHITAYIQGPAFLDIPFLVIPDSRINDVLVADPEEVHVLVELENVMAALDTLGACKFMGFCVSSEEWVKLVEHCLGKEFNYDNLVKIGERAYNLARIFNVREGLTRADDTLPPRLLEEPLPEGPAAGKVNENLPAMLDKYYELRGWDKATGKPTPEKLKELGLEEYITDIWG